MKCFHHISVLYKNSFHPKRTYTNRILYTKIVIIKFPLREEYTVPC